MCTYKSLVPKHYKLYSYLIIKPMDCCYRCYVINDLFDTFPNTMHIMLNIEPQLEKIVLHLYKAIQ